MSKYIDKESKKNIVSDKLTKTNSYNFFIITVEKAQTGIATKLGISIFFVSNHHEQKVNKNIIDYYKWNKNFFQFFCRLLFYFFTGRIDFK